MKAVGKRTPLFGGVLRELRAARLRKRDSLREAEKLLSTGPFPMSHSAIQKYEKGIRQPGIHELEALAVGYGAEWERLAEALHAEITGRAATKSAIERIVFAEAAPPASEAPHSMSGVASVVLLEDPIAAGDPIAIDDARIDRTIPFSTADLRRLGVSHPLCVRVGDDERSMSPTILPGEIVLLDCADRRREQTKPDRIYAVNVDRDSTLKRVIRTPGKLLLVSDNPDKARYGVREVAVNDDESVLQFIVGEVVWKGVPV